MPFERYVLLVVSALTILHSHFSIISQSALEFIVQDPGTEPAKRVWSSLNVGTEIYVSHPGETAEWTVSEFDVLVPEGVEDTGIMPY